MFDDVVTLFCRVGGEKDSDWVRCVVCGVQMAELCGESTETAMASATDRAQLMLPWTVCTGYVEPQKWDALDKTARTGKFTLRTGDVFVRGEVTDEDTPVSAFLVRRGGWKMTSVTQKGVGSALHHFAVGAGRLWSQTGGVL